MSWLWFYCALVSCPAETPIETPKPTDDRLVVELVAREPEIVTPTGVTVDERGRIWVIENQTHHRPADYKGPAGDRIRIYDDFGPDGRARRVKTFAEGFKNGMGMALAPNGELYFATRADIKILRDTDGDDVADKHDVIVKLDTAGDYPHNGLSGFAFDAFDNVYFGFGENLGAPYKLIGFDGTTLPGGGEGGNIYRCRPDGSKLIRVATGFWNPFHLTFDAFGRLFAVDNDPDSRPPCRLLHIIQGGDYGYRFRNGRKGVHPFTAWNGELPGTLPMVAGTGEAPSGIVAYESNGLPDDYRGDLIVTSWGDHVIQRFKLAERGASFTSQAETLVRGGESFYPVGIAIAPDGSLVVTDWADKSYPLHGKGRIWRIGMKEPAPDDGLRPSAVAKVAHSERLFELLQHPKREIRDAAGRALIDSRPQMQSAEFQRMLSNLKAIIERKNMSPRGRMHALWAAARTGSIGLTQWLDHEAPDECDDPAVAAELTRLTVELLHPRRRGDAPPELVQPGSEWVERKWLVPMVADRSVPSPIRLQAALGLYSPRFFLTAGVLLADSDPFLVAAGIESLGRPGNSVSLMELMEQPDGEAAHADRRGWLFALLALRRTGDAGASATITRFLDDLDPGVRRAAIQWVGEDKLTEFEAMIERAAARPPVTRELFEAFLAAKDMLAGAGHKPTDEVAGEEYVAKIVLDPKQSPPLRTIALRTLRPDHPSLTAGLLRRFIESEDVDLRREAVRTLAPRTDGDSVALLRELATNVEADPALRADAVLGLANTAETAATALALARLLEADAPPEVHREVMRSIRGAGNNDNARRGVERCWHRAEQSGFAGSFPRGEFAEQISQWLKTADLKLQFPAHREIAAEADTRRPHSVADWKSVLEVDRDRAGDAKSGERLFFQPRGPQCFACHRINGRGGNVGPDLSAIGRSLDREKLIRSILEPAEDIAPQYTTWLVALRNGQVKSGIILQEDPRGTITLGDNQGKTEEIPLAEIEERQAQTTSIMPDNLVDRMTRQEFRDLFEFLSRLK